MKSKGKRRLRLILTIFCLIAILCLAVSTGLENQGNEEGMRIGHGDTEDTRDAETLNLVENLVVNSIEQRYLIHINVMGFEGVRLFWDVENSERINSFVFRFRYVDAEENLASGEFVVRHEDRSVNYTELTEKIDVCGIRGEGSIFFENQGPYLQLFIYEESKFFQWNMIEYIRAELY